jgi:hypothetical protein
MDMKYGPNSVSVDVQTADMVDRIKRLNNVRCLGEELIVRRVDEASTGTSALAMTYSLALLKSLQQGTDNTPDLELKTSTLKTRQVSSVIKISNVLEREEELTPELFEELSGDFEDELSKIPHLHRFKIVRAEEERLGAEKGYVFVVFKDKRSAELAFKTFSGRVFNGNELKVIYVDDKAFFEDICL